MRRTAILTVAAVPTLLGCASAPRSAPDVAIPAAPAPRCDSVFRVGAVDSLMIEMGARVRAFDPRHPIPSRYGALLAEGLRENLAIPHGLTLDTYDRMLHPAAWNQAAPSRDHVPRDTTAYPVLLGHYKVLLLRSGHLRTPRAIGGVRNAAFDQAVVAALTAIDTLGLMPPLPDSVALPDSGLDVRIDVAPHERTSLHGPANGGTDTTTGVAPLFRMAAPVYRYASPAEVRPGGPFPHYPIDMRERGMMDTVVFQLVVTPEGRPDLGTLQVLRGTTPFVRAVLDVLPRIGFYPMELVRGCPVRALVQLPFVFSLG